ncbi:MAG: DUF393 domain-containing protein [Planctomycetia bacterium]|nr:DUF393 domain-containing protein [Planctomycetia bacterium]
MSVEPATADTSSQSAGVQPSAPPGRPIIFFDGVCGLCSWSVDFVIARDPKAQFQFAPLQVATASDRLGPAIAELLNTVVLLDAHGSFNKSDAVWRILVILGGVWRWVGWLMRLIPRPLRNSGYDFIARRRYRWFGKKETCRLPSAQERARFLP